MDAGVRADRAAALIAAYTQELGDSAEALIGDPWEALSDGLAPLVQAAIGWAARGETRQPVVRMRALQENLLRSVCAWASNEHTGRRIFAPEAGRT